MARKPRLISAPTARGGGGGNTWRQQSGTMFAYSSEDGPIGTIPGSNEPEAAFEAPDDGNYERMIAERERELGLPTGPPGVRGSAYQTPVYEPVPYERLPSPSVTFIADLTALPDRFSLTVERKADGVWKLTAPGVHSGLWKAGTSLPDVVNEALASLAEMVRIDGVVAKGRRK